MYRAISLKKVTKVGNPIVILDVCDVDLLVINRKRLGTLSVGL